MRWLSSTSVRILRFCKYSNTIDHIDSALSWHNLREKRTCDREGYRLKNWELDSFESWFYLIIIYIENGKYDVVTEWKLNYVGLEKHLEKLTLKFYGIYSTKEVLVIVFYFYFLFLLISNYLVFEIIYPSTFI